MMYILSEEWVKLEKYTSVKSLYMFMLHVSVSSFFNLTCYIGLLLKYTHYVFVRNNEIHEREV